MFILALLTGTAQESFRIAVQADKPGAEIRPTMWGVFFEDINFAADGGVYAELVKNRSFEFEFPLSGWRQLSQQNGTGRIVPGFYYPYNPGNPHYVSIFPDAAAGSFGITNEGFRGMGIRKDAQYNFSVKARLHESSGLIMKVELLSASGQIIGTAVISGFTT